jgi:hypothetical protein
VLVAGVAVVGGLLTEGPSEPAEPAARAALVIDSAAGRDGRDLLDARLRHVHAAVRLPRTLAEARTNVRYFAAQGYRIVVTGPRAQAAAHAVGVRVARAPDLAGALAAAGR